ncbi:replication initiation protein RepC [Pseudovibrio exalbescens]|uniref:Uncharacterized protein n=1 Tax=Pseudovibrio exalbescens TaxID=197461 RepID=A0A1U7JL74_9HYPH|nr:replication initiation protein RepC [Pseudovibrio exalbescens]OKL45442.1 hypothetical protein A3843_03730 [Pseudovibrio exalbescens]
MCVTLTHGGLPQEFTRSDLLGLIDAQGSAAGLSGTDIKVIKHYILKVRDEDFRAGRICAVWQRLPVIAQELFLDERAVTRAENRLAKAGWLLKTNAPKSRRAGQREQAGEQRIIWAAGVNLQPLIDHRVPNLLRIARQREAASAELDRARAEAKHLFSEIRALRVSEAIERALEVLPFGRLSRVRAVEQLKKIIEAFSSLLSSFKKQGVGKSVDAFEAGQTKAPSRTDKTSARYNTHQKTLIQNCRQNAVQFSFQQCIENAHKDMRENMRFLGGDSQANFIEAANLLRRDLRISDELWSQACHRLNRVTAAILVSIIYKNTQCPKGHKAHVRHAAACFRKLIQRATFEPQFLSRVVFKNLKGDGVGSWAIS